MMTRKNFFVSLIGIALAPLVAALPKKTSKGVSLSPEERDLKLQRLEWISIGTSENPATCEEALEVMKLLKNEEPVKGLAYYDWNTLLRNVETECFVISSRSPQCPPSPEDLKVITDSLTRALETGEPLLTNGLFDIKVRPILIHFPPGSGKSEWNCSFSSTRWYTPWGEHTISNGVLKDGTPYKISTQWLPEGIVVEVSQ